MNKSTISKEYFDFEKQNQNETNLINGELLVISFDIDDKYENVKGSHVSHGSHGSDHSSHSSHSSGSHGSHSSHGSEHTSHTSRGGVLK